MDKRRSSPTPPASRKNHVSEKDAFPSLCPSEMREMKDFTTNTTARNGELRIFPRNVKTLLEKNYRFVYDQIRTTVKEDNYMVFGKQALNNTAIDAWIFRSTKPILLLTFMTNDVSGGECRKHNQTVADLTVQEMNKTGLGVRLTNSVVDRETSISEEKYTEMLLQLEARAASDSNMGNECFEKELRSFIETVSGKNTNKRKLILTGDTAEKTESPVTCVVVSSERRKLEDHVQLLQQHGFQATSVLCNVTDDLMSIDTKRCDRVDLLVDSSLCSIMKNRQQLKDIVLQTFSGNLARLGTEVVLFNAFPPEDNGDEFNEVFFQMPREIRKRPKESAYNHLLPPLKKQKTVNTIESIQIGYKNKVKINPQSKQKIVLIQTGRSNILQIVAPNEKSHLMVSTKTNPDRREIEEMIISVMKGHPEDIQEDVQGVSTYTVEKGSIIIKLELEPGQMVTDQWLTTVLQALFTDEVCSLIPDGVTLDLDIDATFVVTGEDVAKFALNSDVHENCVSKSEYEELQTENDKLKMKSPHWNDALISEWLEKGTATTSSGYHTESIASSVFDTGEDVEQLTSSGEGCYLSKETEDCGRCRMTYKGVSPYIQTAALFILHIEKSYILEPGRKQISDDKEKRREKKSRLRKLLLRCVSAVLNNDGGQILIHMHNGNFVDKKLGYFDEFISESLTDLLAGSVAYTFAYSRRVLSEVQYEKHGQFGKFRDFILLDVEKSPIVATTDFNTKCSNDVQLIMPTPLLLRSMLSQPIQESTKPRISGFPDASVDECRSIHLKDFSSVCTIPVRAVETSNRIWFHMRLREYITSMSKIKEGGSYYLVMMRGGKDTKNRKIDGCIAPSIRDELKRKLCDKMKSEMCVLNKATMTFRDAPDDLIEIAFHEVPGKGNGSLVLEVAIRYFDGIVFYDKEGPRTHTLEDGKVCRMDKTKWLDRLRSFQVYTF